MLYKYLPFLCHLHLMSSRDAKDFKRLSRSLPLSILTVTERLKHILNSRTQENRPKFLWARRRPLSLWKSVRSLFFRPLVAPSLRPLVRDHRSAAPLISYHQFGNVLVWLQWAQWVPHVPHRIEIGVILSTKTDLIASNLYNREFSANLNMYVGVYFDVANL